ncbi:F-box protein: endocytic membrane traffic, recycling ReCYcling 1 [Clavispora lusitaniae]|nr:F-box protein: endocytic membrane traffic, recycling ReCYcling 1 [Clavispora lusitaniae]
MSAESSAFVWNSWGKLFESFASGDEEKVNFRAFCVTKMTQWNALVREREENTTQQILKHVKVEAKNDFLSSFKKVFTINTGSDNKPESDEQQSMYSQMQARAKILAENIKSIG